MKKSINILMVGIIILSALAMTTTADNGKDNAVNEPSFKISDNPGQNSAEAATHVFVGFRSKPGAQERSLVQGHNGKISNEFPEVQAFAIDIPASAVAGLSRNPKVLYVEEDPMRYPLSLANSDLEPALTNGLYGLITTKATAVQVSGVTGAGATACIADTAIDSSHPDITGNLIETKNFNSQSIDPSETHATHVAGTIVAAMNGNGVRGVAYDAKLYHARVLGPKGGSASEVMNGVSWLVETKGCRNVGLSLGGSIKSRTEENFYKKMYQKGALIIAAAGNDNQRRLSYPAGYQGVLSIGAVDRNNLHASFSNTGKNLDLSAPGVDVLSSVPIGRGFESSVFTDIYYQAFGMEYAGKTTGSGITGTIVNSGTGNTPSEFPSNVAGNIALMKRGTETFATKVRNAMNAGAVAAIIYNNVAGDFTGTLGSSTTSDGHPWIPVVSVSDSTGTTLVNQAGTTGTVVNQVSDWDSYSGTSMATPHVVGVAALVMSANPSLTNTQVENILMSTATDLGTAGYDTTFGYGLVNASKAVEAATSH